MPGPLFLPRCWNHRRGVQRCLARLIHKPLSKWRAAPKQGCSPGYPNQGERFSSFAPSYVPRSRDSTAREALPSSPRGRTSSLC
jgi:hypothetical protein